MGGGRTAQGLARLTPNVSYAKAISSTKPVVRNHVKYCRLPRMFLWDNHVAVALR